MLEDHADVAAVNGEMTHGVAVDADGAGVRLDEAGDGAQQRGLAAPARSEQGEELPLLDSQMHVIEHRRLAEALGDTLDLDDAHWATTFIGPQRLGGEEARWPKGTFLLWTKGDISTLR